MSLFISFWVSIGSRMPQANLRAQKIEIGKLDFFLWFLMLIGHTKAGMYVWKYYGAPIF